MRWLKAARVLFIILISIFGFLVLLFAFINLPFTQGFVTTKTNGILEKSNVPIHIDDIQRVLPNSVKIQGIVISDITSDTIIHVGSLKARVRLRALIRKRVILKNLDLRQTSMDLLMNYESRKYTIAETFTAGREPGEKKEKKKAAWVISVKKGKLSTTHFRMSDSISGIHILQDISNIGLKDFTVSLPAREIVANTLELDDLAGNIAIEPRREKKKKEKKGPPWNFGLLNLSLNEIDFTYSKSSDGFSLETHLEEGKIRADQMDVRSKVIDIKRISLAGVTTTIHTGDQSGKQQVTKDKNQDDFPWHLKGRVIDFEDVDLNLARDSIQVAGLDMKLRRFQLDKDHAGVEINKLDFVLDNGFAINEIKGELDSDAARTELNLALETGNSQFRLQGEAEEGFLGIVSNPGGIPKAGITISDTELSLEDLTYFSSQLKDRPYFMILANRPYSLGGDIDIVESSLSFSEFSLRQDQDFNLGMEGSLEHPFPLSEAFGNVNLSLSDIDVNWLNKVMTGFGLEEGFRNLSSLSLKSTISDSLLSPEFDLQLNSDLGNIEGSGSISFKSDSFSVHASFAGILLGDILNSPELGSFTGSVEASGKGFTSESLESDIALQVDSILYHGYNYTQARIIGSLRPDEYKFDIQVDDSALMADLAAVLNPGDSIFELQASGTVKSQLQALHFYSDTLFVETYVDGNLVKGSKALETDIKLTGTTLNSPYDAATIRQVDLRFKTDSIGTMLRADADFFHIDLEIALPYSELDNIGLGYERYFETFTKQNHVNAPTRVLQLPEINAKGNIDYHNALGVFIQDTSLRYASLDFSLINIPSNERINYRFSGSGIAYKFLKIGNLNTAISDSAGILYVQIAADENSINASPASKLRLNSRFKEGHSLTTLHLQDNQDEIVYGFEIATILDSSQIVFSVPSGELILNRENWQMDSTSLLTLNAESPKLLPNLRMHTDSSVINLLTERGEGYISYHGFLGNVGHDLIIQEGLLSGEPEGSLSGTLEYSLIGDVEKSLNTDLEIKDLLWSGLAFNRASINGSFTRDSSRNYEIDMSVNLDSSTIVVSGDRIHGGTGILEAEFTSVPVYAFQPFVRNYLSELRGDLSGRVSLSSRGDQENFGGKLFINDAHVRINTLNAVYRIPEDSVGFSGKKIVFDKFRVEDSLKNELLVNGFIGFDDNWSAYTDMEVSSSKLQVMNRSEKEDVPLYGDIFVDSRLSFKGPLVGPAIKGSVLLSEGTDVFYRHMEDLTLSETEKIVQFVDHSSKYDPDLSQPIQVSNNAINSSIETIVEIDPATRINFNLAKRIYNIDIMIQGGGSLNYNMLNNNQVALSGKYEISNGNADVKLIGWPNKSFRIVRGGFIRWDGLIDNPELNFEALNKVSSSYTNPVDGAQRDVDFNVILKLSNQLSDLDILFTINTNDQYLMSIINTLSPEEQMRQAITILLFEYIDLPGISTSSTYMSQQVSQLLATQLNDLAKTTIQGVDISFGIDTYTQSTDAGGEETKTSLSYEVRKSFLNDRAQIEFSGRMDDLTQQQGNTDFSVNNLSFEYRLDSAASQFIKVYNEHSYEDVFTGEIVKTGVGFTYRKKYQYFRDIWRRKNRKQDTVTE